MRKYIPLILFFGMCLACSCSQLNESHSAFEEYQMLRTIDSSLYVRISYMAVTPTEKVWKLELGELKGDTFVAIDRFYGAREWQGSQGGCYWWTFAETHILDAISYCEESSAMYLPAGYELLYPQLEGIMTEDRVDLFPL